MLRSITTCATCSRAMEQKGTNPETLYIRPACSDCTSKEEPLALPMDVLEAEKLRSFEEATGIKLLPWQRDFVLDVTARV